MSSGRSSGSSSSSRSVQTNVPDYQKLRQAETERHLRHPPSLDDGYSAIKVKLRELSRPRSTIGYGSEFTVPSTSTPYDSVTRMTGVTGLTGGGVRPVSADFSSIAAPLDPSHLYASPQVSSHSHRDVLRRTYSYDQGGGKHLAAFGGATPSTSSHALSHRPLSPTKHTDTYTSRDSGLTPSRSSTVRSKSRTRSFREDIPADPPDFDFASSPPRRDKQHHRRARTAVPAEMTSTRRSSITTPVRKEIVSGSWRDTDLARNRSATPVLREKLSTWTSPVDIDISERRPRRDSSAAASTAPFSLTSSNQPSSLLSHPPSFSATQPSPSSNQYTTEPVAFDLSGASARDARAHSAALQTEPLATFGGVEGVGSRAGRAVSAVPMLGRPAAGLSDWHRQYSDGFARAHPSSTDDYRGAAHSPYRDLADTDSVKQAKDSLLREKDLIIKQQKMEMLEMDERVQTLRLPPAAPDTSLSTRVQELEYQQTSLRAELAGARQRAAQADHLERKLGKAEYELEQKKKGSDEETTQKLHRDIKKLETQVESKGGEAAEWKSRHEELETHLSDLKSQLSSLEGYMADLPTKDENKDAATEVEELREMTEAQDTRLAELEKRLHTCRTDMWSAQQEARDLTRQRDEHLVVLEELEAERERLEQALSKDVSRAQLQRLAHDRDRLALDLARARKLVEKQQAAGREREVATTSEKRQLQQRVQHEEGSMTALRRDLALRQTEINKLKSRLKQTMKDKQDLLDQQLSLKEELATAKALAPDAREQSRLIRRLTAETRRCCRELGALVTAARKHAEGQAPDLAGLLPTAESAEERREEEEEGGGLSEAWLRRQLECVGDTRSQLDHLRSSLADTAAHDMGAYVSCAQQ